MLTHTNLISNVLDASEKFSFTGRDISLSVLPLSHVFERTGMYVYILYGMQVFYAESIEKTPENLKEVRPTIFIGVPRIFEKVFERARLKAALAGRVNEIVFDWAVEVAKEYAAALDSGGPIPVAIQRQTRYCGQGGFLEAAGVFWRAPAFLYNGRSVSAGRDLSDLYRCRYLNNAGVRP
jgi:long-chain acyl-CoA synthetase